MAPGLDHDLRSECIGALHDVLLQLAAANLAEVVLPLGPSDAPKEHSSIYWGFSLHISDISAHLIDGELFLGRGGGFTHTTQGVGSPYRSALEN
jgi:hypothetical protein